MCSGLTFLFLVSVALIPLHEGRWVAISFSFVLGR